LDYTKVGNLYGENITYGTIPSGRLSGSYTGITGVGTITTGIWQASPIQSAYIGNLPASKITSGVFSVERIPVLNYTKVGNLYGENITYGTISTARLPSEVVLTTGSYANPSWITSLDWSKITNRNLNIAWSGELGWGNLTAYPSACPAGQAVHAIGDTLTCIDLSQYGNVTGLGTVNYIPIWTSASNLGNSVIYQNNSNVGIGTTNPLRPLHVYSPNGYGVLVETDNGLDSFEMYSSSYNAYFNIKSRTGGNYNSEIRLYNGGSNYGIIQQNYGNYLALGYNTETPNSLIINSNGNIGIGTTNPSAKLDISDGRIRVLASSSYPTTGGAGIEVGYWQPGDYAFILGYNRSGSQYKPIRVEGSRVSLAISGNEKLVVDSSGKIGIGTTTPNRVFHVVGSGETVVSEFERSGSVLVDIVSSGGSDTGIRFDSSGVSSYTMGIDSGNNSFIIGRGLNDPSSLPYKDFVIDSSGNIGVGTINPQGKVDIVALSGDGVPLNITKETTAGSSQIETLRLVANTTATASGGFGPEIQFYSIWNGGSRDSGKIAGILGPESGKSSLAFYAFNGASSVEMMRVTSSGIGIGTTSPSEKLDVAGTFKATSNGAILNVDSNGDVKVGV
jgi:hypothetical protein